MTNPSMGSDQSVQTWKEQKAKLMAKYDNLNDSDLQFEDGKKDVMMERLQKKLGKTKEELASIMEAL